MTSNDKKEQENHLYVQYWVIEEVGHTIACLHGLIYGLQQKNGYCYASNSYLAKVLKLSKPTINSHIKIMEHAELLVKVVDDRNNRIMFVRPSKNSLLPSKNSLLPLLNNFTTLVKNFNHPQLNILTTPSKNSLLYNKYNNKYNNKEIERATHKLPNSNIYKFDDSGSERKPLKKFPNIYLSENEEKTLLQLYNSENLSLNDIASAYLKFDNWRKDNQTEFGKLTSHFSKLTGWVKNQIKQDKIIDMRYQSQINYKNKNNVVTENEINEFLQDD